jgi:hypothetical protein
MKTPPIPHYEVLRPVLEKTGQRGMHHEYGPFDWYAVRWVVIGFAESMADAKAQFGGAPVLQRAVISAVRH